MTTPRHGSKTPSRQSNEWSSSFWLPSSDAAVRLRRRVRRAQQAQRLHQLRAEIATAAERHPSRWEHPATAATVGADQLSF
jgi:hypothetical protein